MINKYVKELFTTFNRMKWNIGKQTMGMNNELLLKQKYKFGTAPKHLDMPLSIGNTGQHLVFKNLTLCQTMGNFNKNMKNDDVKHLFEIMRQHYSQHQMIYTDASVNKNGVGVGLFMAKENVEKFFKVDKSICITNAELIGIYEGIKLAKNYENRKTVIFSDCLSGIRLVKSGGGKKGNVYVDMILEYVRNWQCDVTIQWVPSHRQIEGNDKADMLAKKGAIYGSVQKYEKKDVKDVLRMI